jgi:predicted DsbA family dithiol-disulfide isomerase
VNVEIFADVVCPWCYLGQARFRDALKDFDGTVEVTWRPYQLDPSAPTMAISADEHLLEIFGSPERVAAAHARMHELTAAENLPYAPDRARHVNTAAAHRVIWLAGREGGAELQDAVAARLFRAHHAEGRDVGDAATLAELAGEAGLKAEAVLSLLASDEGTAELAEQVARARELGITGVPFFLFEGAWGVSGAQPAEALSGALREVAGKLAQRS